MNVNIIFIIQIEKKDNKQSIIEFDLQKEEEGVQPPSRSQGHQ